jgi:hypothetical protein
MSFTKGEKTMFIYRILIILFIFISPLGCMKKLHIYFERPKKQASEPIEVKTQELLSSYMFI